MSRIKPEYQLTDKEGICPQCLSQIKVNHGNRKFCNNRCKIRFNNQNAKEKLEKVKPYFGPLLKNILILEYYFLMGIFEISYEDLLIRGFDFNALTNREHIFGTNKFKLTYGSFVLIKMSNNTFKLSKNEE
jgi:hypothetical protein